MLIDRKSRPWIFFTLLLFAAATVVFIWYSRATQGQPSGGSWTGLGFGAAGSAAMLIAMLLAVRKKTRSLYLGRPYYWMQAHVWFGLLSYPLILYHAGGFAWGGTLTQVIMWLFTAVFISGIIGIILQQVIPTRLLRDVPAETIAAQINHVLETLRQEADAIMQPLRAGRERDAHAIAAGGAATALGTDALTALGMGGTTTAAPPMTQASLELIAFDEFYSHQLVPFLGSHFHRDSPLANAVGAQETFSKWRGRLPAPLHPAISRLEALVDERRQLARQRRLQYWLTSWLLIHVPLSYTLIVLASIHAVMAFRFTTPGR